MWAIAIKAQSTITIVAQNLEPFREVLPDEPAIENCTAFTDGPSMLGASAIHMINRKKLYPRFMTTSTFPPIVTTLADESGRVVTS